MSIQFVVGNRPLCRRFLSGHSGFCFFKTSVFQIPIWQGKCLMKSQTMTLEAFPKLIPQEFKDLIHVAKAGVIVVFKFDSIPTV